MQDATKSLAETYARRTALSMTSAIVKGNILKIYIYVKKKTREIKWKLKNGKYHKKKVDEIDSLSLHFTSSLAA